MKCPIDTNVDLVMADRSGIEIDYCPTCRGVWLDRGELDKIIDRSLAATGARPGASDLPMPAPAAAPVERERPWHERDERERRRDWDDDDDDDDWKKYKRTDGYKKKRKSSILGEIFDF